MLIALASVLVLVVVYRQPVVVRQMMGQGNVAMTGLHPTEHNGTFAYAYTRGDATLVLPQLGHGTLALTLRLGGAGETPLAAQLGTPAPVLDLGVVQAVRAVHVLLPTNQQGALALHITSATVQPPGDPRRIGVLLERLELRSLGGLGLPASVRLGLPVLLGLVWMVLGIVRIPYGHKVGWLAGTAVAVCLGYLLCRGNMMLRPWWVALPGLALLSGVGLARLGRFDGRHFATPWRGLAVVFGVWRVALWLVAGVGIWGSSGLYPWGKRLTFGGTPPDQTQRLWQTLVGMWGQWDGIHYRAIARSGYTFSGDLPNIAFFPLYPALIRLLRPLLWGSDEFAALVITHVALGWALWMLYHLLADDFGTAMAYQAIVLLLLFPTAVFFVMSYSEALALALLVTALWAIRRERWWTAGLLGGLLTLTRLPGVLIAPVIAWAYLEAHGWRWRTVRWDSCAVVVPPLALAVFMGLQWLRFGTPVAFLLAQRNWSNQLSPPWTIPLEVWHLMHGAAYWPIRVFQGATWIAFVVLTVVAVVRLPRLYGVAMLLFLAPAFLSNWHDSFPRYVLLGFPAWIALALVLRRPWQRVLVVGCLVPLQIVAILLLANGFWLA